VIEAVRLITIRVRVARDIEPVHRHALAVGRRREQTIHDLLVGVRRFVREEGIHLGGRRRETGEVEAHAAEQTFFRRFRRGLQLLAFELREDELIDLVAHPLAILCLGHRHVADGDERPVLLPFRALLDPFLEERDLVRAQREVRLRRRHDLLRVSRGQAMEQLTLRGVAGLDDELAVLQRLERALRRIKPELALARFLIRAVTEEAAVREQRLDVIIEVDAGRKRGCAEGQHGRGKKHGGEAGEQPGLTRRPARFTEVGIHCGISLDGSRSCVFGVFIRRGADSKQFSF
jgi:hypothetical protein